MIRGALYWNDPERLYVQDNNAIETLVPGLEYCGPTMDVIAWAALTNHIEAWINPFHGSWKIQPEDYVTAFYLDHRNWPDFQNIRKLDFSKHPPNRVPQYRQFVMQRVFGMAAEYKDFGTFESIAGLLVEGDAVGLCLKKPGHYICAVAYDDETKQIGFKDPWAGNRWPGGDAIPDQHNNKWMAKSDFNANIHNWHIIYRKR